MNAWGFVVERADGTELYSDFGYETEKEAEDVMNMYFRKSAERAGDHRIYVCQRWIGL